MPSATVHTLLFSWSMVASFGETEFGIYVHWPFCESKCPYCDFNSHVRDAVDSTRWQAAYLAELDAVARRFGPRSVGSIFFGGGTPSLMSPELVSAVLEGIAAKFELADDAEVTLEANPSSAEAVKFRGFADAGVNRISVGVQSFDDAQLRFLKRAHNSDAARLAVAAAVAAVPRVSIDLIYALPLQSVVGWRKELVEAVAMGCEHVSAYQLTLETGTPFFHAAQTGKLRLPDDDTAVALFDATQKVCRDAGLFGYEISNYALPGAECRHNILYWRSGDWAGVGPGAHGRRTGSDGRFATTQFRSPEAWLAAVEAHGTGAEPEERLTSLAVRDEVLLMGLRLSEGISESRFRSLTGHSLMEAFAETLPDFIDEALLEWNGGALRATAKGRLLIGRLVEVLSADRSTSLSPSGM